jgi:hypothetical protein
MTKFNALSEDHAQWHEKRVCVLMAHLTNLRLKYDFQGWRFLAKALLHSNQLQEITKVRIAIILYRNMLPRVLG